MMRFKIYFSCLIGVVFLLVCSLSPICAEDKIKLTYAMHFVKTHEQCRLQQDWCDEITKRTQGRVEITMFPGGTLIPSAQNYDGIVKGIADIGFSWFAFTRGRFPLLEVCDLPLTYKTGLAATRLVNEVYKKFKPKELDDVKVLFLGGHGPGILHTASTPVHKLEDVAGLKIGCSGTTAKIVKALGGTPVAMPAGEAYDATKRGVVNARLISLEAMEQWKLGEVLHYHIGNYSSAYTTSHFVVMNKAKWNSLPVDIQKVFEEVSEEWIWRTGMVWNDVDKSARKFVEKIGNTFIELSPQEQERWAKAVKPLLKQWADKTDNEGLPGTEALNYCVERLKYLQ